MARLIPILFSLVLATGCSQRITVVKAHQEDPAGQLSVFSGQPGQADSVYDRALDEGVMLMRQGDFKGARRWFEQALSRNPSGWQSYYYLGLTLSRQEQHVPAYSRLQSSLTYAPPDKRVRSRIYLAIAETLEKQGKLGQAQLNYITALNLHPDSSPATAGLERVEQLRRQLRR